jgi:hypothetical protein
MYMGHLVVGSFHGGPTYSPLADPHPDLLLCPTRAFADACIADDLTYVAANLLLYPRIDV